LLPGRFLADRLLIERPIGAKDDVERRRRHLEGWWRRLAAVCGPATGMRSVFDMAAMPLFGTLGFRARDAGFDSHRPRAHARLETRTGVAVGLVVLPWAHRPSASWRDVAASARAAGADWCFVMAPPFLSLVDARGHASRRSLEVAFPEVLDPESFGRFWVLCSAGSFDTGARTTSRERDRDHPPSPIDRIVAASATFQDLVRVDLQEGVVDALSALARVPVAGRSKTPLPADETLTVIFRILFLLFAESRRLVPRDHPVYGAAYAVTELCRQALHRAHAPGLWEGLAAISRLSRQGCRTEDLDVPPFNGALFARMAAPSLEAQSRKATSGRRADTADAAMRAVLVALGSRPGASGREEISYSDLGVEQLGAVYERVLDIDPSDGTAVPPEPRRQRQASRRARHTDLRKRTGTFYTPQPLTEFVVRRTLTPLVTGASSDAILALRVLDPAMGSGAFLVAACRFLAGAYERALVAEGRTHESDIDEDRRADYRRQVAERCLAGVDANPVAVQLARLSLWLTTLAHGKPLGFLDHRLRVGDSLIGASPDDLTRVHGRGAAAASPLPLFAAAGLDDVLQRVVRPLAELSTRRDETVDDVHAKSAIWRRLSGAGSPLAPWRQAADLWCGRWFLPGDRAPSSPQELRAALDAVLKGDGTLGSRDLLRWLQAARVASEARRFFHWPLEFADVFYDEHGSPRPRGGFDAVLGNPPWDMLRHDSGRGGAATGERDPTVRFIRESGLYASCDRGHVNLYQPFLDRALSLTRDGGRVGLVLPWGLAVDEGSAALRKTLLERCATSTIVGIDNGGGIFPIHRGLRFLVVVTSPAGPTREIRARFGVRTMAELDELPGRDDPQATAYPVRLTPALVRTIGGSTSRFPDLRHARDLGLIERLTASFPRLGSSPGGAARFGRELNATDDRASFGGEGLPIIEGKHIVPFRVEVATATKRIARSMALARLPDRRFDRPRLAYRDVSGVGNRWTLIAAVLPPGVVTTHTLFCLRTAFPIQQQHYLCGLFNSFVLNALVRMLMGSHVTTGLVEDLPAPPWTGAGEQRRLARLAARLARQPGSASTQAWLQASVARLYRLDRETFAHVLAGFPHVAPAIRDAALARLVPAPGRAAGSAL
jgi:hypothetical protein